MRNKLIVFVFVFLVLLAVGFSIPVNFFSLVTGSVVGLFANGRVVSMFLIFSGIFIAYVIVLRKRKNLFEKRLSEEMMA